MTRVTGGGSSQRRYLDHFAPSKELFPHEPQSMPGNDQRDFTAPPPNLMPCMSSSHSQCSVNRPTRDISAWAPHEDLKFVPPGQFSTDMNWSSSSAPVTFCTRSRIPDYRAHGSAWPMNGSLNFHLLTCDNQMPTHVPELGYDTVSAACDSIGYPRLVTFESPLPETEQQDTHSVKYQAISTDDGSNNVGPCYAELLRQCLLGAPDYTMSLRDLYAWVAEHSPKAKDPSSTGWKSSVRHNLSRNKVHTANLNFEQIRSDTLLQTYSPTFSSSPTRRNSMQVSMTDRNLNHSR